MRISHRTGSGAGHGSLVFSQPLVGLSSLGPEGGLDGPAAPSASNASNEIGISDDLSTSETGEMLLMCGSVDAANALRQRHV